MAEWLFRVGWFLMGLPCGVSEPWQWWLDWGPYRWGAWLVDQANKG